MELESGDPPDSVTSSVLTISAMRSPLFRAAAARAAVIALPLLLGVACGLSVPEPVTAENRVGDAVCLGCHTEQAAFSATAHHRTSAPATLETVHGSFRDGDNILRTVNPALRYRMEARPDGLFQSAVLGAGPDTTIISERFEIVVGSGRKGQSYLYWRDENLLHQLPVSYWTELGEWVQSPGYRDGVIEFGRQVNPRCVECHATAFPPADAGEPHRYDRGSTVLGISCESCHGAGREHVERQASWLRRIRGPAIVNPAHLSRERQLDACALCHGGIGEPLAPAFTYLPGQPLAEHVRQPVPTPEQAVEVHGNQVALLRRSPCFQSSQMTCATCHDVHETQRDPGELSGACLACHQPQSCGRFPEHGMELAGRCAGCHMPELPSNTIVSSHGGTSVRPSIRSHWIRIYESDELREARGVPF